MAHGLNPAQAEAVAHLSGPLLVLAGAGSGKTRVITQRIARLVEETGVAPTRIIAVSFTNKAAAEMRERMEPLVGKRSAEKLWLSTFHSFGVRFLQEENRALGFDGRFVIFDQGDSLGLLRELLRDEFNTDGRSLDMYSLMTRISLWKNAFLAPDEVPERDFEYDAIARKLYPRYVESLSSMHAVDFDDLVVHPVRILKTREDIREKWRARFEHLLVDEFQDTNKSQLELVKLLTNDQRNVCVVGDDDQSIYGWRGAEVGNILDFEQTFPGAKVVKLETNYRSRKPILDVANAVIAKSKGKRHAKTLVSHKGPGPKVRNAALNDATAEAKFVVSEIRELAKGGEHSPDQRRFRFGEIAVLYRSNQQAKILEEELRVGGIPYRLFGGTQFFDRKEIKDLIAYLRAVDNPRDELSLRRVINTPPRGIGDKSLQKVRAYGVRHGMPFAEALRHAQELDIPAGAKRGIHGFVGLLEQARRELREGVSVVHVTQHILQRSGLRQNLDSDESSAGPRRRENVDFFLRSVQRYESADNKPSLGQFLTRITLRFDQEEEEAGNQVTLSSLHSSKGLEFDVVFLIGCVEGQLPHSRTTDPKITEAAPTDVEEERRLFYVGVTRARELLYISRPSRKSTRGKIVPQVPSRFLEGFPEDAWESYTPMGEKPMSSDEIADMATQLLAQLRR